MWQAWTNVIVGIWIALAPFVPMSVSTVKFNNMVMGAIATLASYLLPKRKLWERGVGTIFGVWVFVAGCIPHFVTGSPYLWSNFGSGILIAFAGLFAVKRSQAQVTRLLDAPGTRLVVDHSAEGRHITSRAQSHE